MIKPVTWVIKDISHFILTLTPKKQKKNILSSIDKNEYQSIALDETIQNMCLKHIFGIVELNMQRKCWYGIISKFSVLLGVRTDSNLNYPTFYIMVL